MNILDKYLLFFTVYYKLIDVQDSTENTGERDGEKSIDYINKYKK